MTAFRSNYLGFAQIVAWTLAAIIAVLSLTPPDLRPETGMPHNLEHALIYSATGIAFALGYDRRYGLLSIFLIIFAGAIETAQLFVPGRHARLGDFVVDAVAVCAAPVAALLVRQLRALRLAARMTAR